MTDLSDRVRVTIQQGFGSPAGVWVIRHLFQPLDHTLYRLSGGRVLLVNFMLPTLMLTTTGAKSGQPRTVPLVYLRDGKRIVLMASNYGSTSHPAWYYNLRANPECMVSGPGPQGRYRGREAEGEEREELWKRAVVLYAGYNSYKERAGARRIPVMVLEPAAP